MPLDQPGLLLPAELRPKLAPSPCGMIPTVFQEALELLSTWIPADGCGIGLWIARMRPELGLRRDPWSWFEALGLGLSGCFLRSKRILKFQVFPRISLLGTVQITLGWKGKQGITFSLEEAAMELWEFSFLWAALPKSQKSSGECAPPGILSLLEGKNPPKHKGNLGMS